MQDALVSVIVPVYKVEKCLEECLKSIVGQTYKKLEIILVDDGSPDNCPAMCDLWAQKDGRIKVIHKPNGGLSSARNAGLDISCGNFVMFVIRMIGSMKALCKAFLRSAKMRTLYCADSALNMKTERLFKRTPEIKN